MKFMPQALTRTAGNQVLAFKQNRPHIAFGIGIAGVIAGNVLACRATTKLSDVMDETQYEIADVKEHREEGSEERYKDLAYVYGKASWRMVRLYGPSVAVTGVSIVLLTGSHVELTKRNKALTATVVGLTKAFDEYRTRVRAELGEEREREVYYGAGEVNIVDENGVATTVIAPIGDPSKISPYACMFDEFSLNWQRNSEMNRLFLQGQQNYYNQLLNTRGHVFLNEIYDAIGVERTGQGAVVGWTADGDGDRFIDFGIFSTNDNGFINGINQSVLLDFNVDGPILDKI